MSKLLQLLHDLVARAVPQGNAQGELHGLADEIVADLASHIEAVTVAYVDKAITDRLGPAVPSPAATPAGSADGPAGA